MYICAYVHMYRYICGHVHMHLCTRYICIYVYVQMRIYANQRKPVQKVGPNNNKGTEITLTPKQSASRKCRLLHLAKARCRPSSPISGATGRFLLGFGICIKTQSSRPSACFMHCLKPNHPEPPNLKPNLAPPKREQTR